MQTFYMSVRDFNFLFFIVVHLLVLQLELRQLLHYNKKKHKITLPGTSTFTGPASAAAAQGFAGAGDELMSRQVNHSPVSPVSKLAPLSEQSGKYGSAGGQGQQGGGQSYSLAQARNATPFPVVTAATEASAFQQAPIQATVPAAGNKGIYGFAQAQGYEQQVQLQVPQRSPDSATVQSASAESGSGQVQVPNVYSNAYKTNYTSANTNNIDFDGSSNHGLARPAASVASSAYVASSGL